MPPLDRSDFRSYRSTRDGPSPRDRAGHAGERPYPRDGSVQKPRRGETGGVCVEGITKRTICYDRLRRGGGTGTGQRDSSLGETFILNRKSMRSVKESDEVSRADVQLRADFFGMHINISYLIQVIS